MFPNFSQYGLAPTAVQTGYGWAKLWHLNRWKLSAPETIRHDSK